MHTSALFSSVVSYIIITNNQKAGDLSNGAYFYFSSNLLFRSTSKVLLFVIYSFTSLLSIYFIDIRPIVIASKYSHLLRMHPICCARQRTRRFPRCPAERSWLYGIIPTLFIDRIVLFREHNQRILPQCKSNNVIYAAEMKHITFVFERRDDPVIFFSW